MKMEKATKDRITRNIALSLFIYLLPVVLMYFSFVATGQRPWLAKAKNQINDKSITLKNTSNNGSND